MSITDELRKWLKSLYTPNSGAVKDEGERIADRIDTAHETACAEAYGNGVMSVPIALDESVWVELPKDANGEYIHVGDEMCGYGWPNGGVYCRAIVNEVTILVGPQDGAYRGWLMWAANECRHYHAPTVEDVLCDLLNEYRENECTLEEARLSEYAKRLTLTERKD